MTDQIILTGDAAKALREWCEIWQQPGFVKHPLAIRILAALPPPKDPDDVLAAEMCAQYFERQGREGRAAVFRYGQNRNNDAYNIALMCIREGREAEKRDMGK